MTKAATASKETTAITVNNDELGLTQADIMALNMGGSDASLLDLPRIVVPKLGATVWEYEADDETKITKELKGIIIARSDFRNYYEGEFDPNNIVPPTCASRDMKHGTLIAPITTGRLIPAGACADCPCNQFGSAAKGKGKACAEYVDVFFVMEGSPLPYKIKISPTNLTAFRTYGRGLATKRIPLFAVRTAISLVSADGAMGQLTKLVFKFIEVLHGPELLQAKEDYENYSALVAQSSLEEISIEADKMPSSQAADWFETADKAPKGQIVDDVPTF